ncbi:MAG: hypothetical protein L6R37_008009 [Teloschistes peruensis]|nr:MAG: hypothetical protein L6R37_008009 [Teloschistes peruensis]
MSSVKVSNIEDPNLIATLIPFDKYERAENAFRLEDNEKHCLPPTRGILKGPTISSREATPAQEQPDNDQCQYDFTHRLQLTFGKEPMDARGYSFGTDKQKCDILLGNRGAYGISGLHYRTTFDDTIDAEPHLILKDSSTHGTAVGYSDQAIMEVRRYFTWILDLKKENGKWEIVVNAEELRFEVELANHETCKTEYFKKLYDYSQLDDEKEKDDEIASNVDRLPNLMQSLLPIP